MIKVGILGAMGKMGREVCRAVDSAPDMIIAAAVDAKGAGSPVSSLSGPPDGQVISADISALTESGAEVAVDFTTAAAAPANVKWCLQNGVHAVVGTTGIAESELTEIEQLSEGSAANVVLAPNFAIGAVLMMRFSQTAAEWLPDAEIIEMHHPGKLDSPSGTSIRTAKGIARGRKSGAGGQGIGEQDAQQTLAGARGAVDENVHIHSVRLPGLVAHQQVIFGGPGETLSIRHDSTDRSCFMPGVLLAIREVSRRPGLTVGLEHLLGL